MDFFKIFITMFLTLFCCSINASAETSVIAFTDKTNYLTGEKIKIAIKNNTKEEIYSHIHSQTPISSILHIEKEQGDNTEKIYAQCQHPRCTIDTDVPLKINPKEVVSMIWIPVVYQNGSTENEKLRIGKYRISILYENNLQTDWKTIYTNSFTIY